MQKKIGTVWLACAGLCSVALSMSVWAEVVVVVHPSNTATLAADDIAKIYLGRTKAFPNWQTVLPVAQSEQSPATAIFNEKVLNKTGSQMKAYWSKLVFTGKGSPPKEVDSDAEIVALVSQNPNVIGYIDKAAVTDKVKVLATF